MVTAVLDGKGFGAQNAQGVGLFDVNVSNSDHSNANAGFLKVSTSDGERLFDAYFTERGIPLDKATLVAELVTPRQTAKLTGFCVWAAKLYYWNPDGSRIEDFFRLRFLEVRSKGDPYNGWPDFRFWQAKGSGSRLYQPVPLLQGSQTWLELQDDTSELLATVEGEVVAMKLAPEGIPAVALGGLWNHADRSHSQHLLKEFQGFRLTGRKVEVNFDNDIAGNDSSLAALFHFSKALSNAGAEVSSWQPPQGKAKGPGDYITAFGVKAYKHVRRVPFALAEQLQPYNNNPAVLANPPKILKEADGTFVLYTASALKDSFEKTKVPVRQRSGKVVDRLLLDEWLEWGGRRSYKGIDYVPGAPRRLPNELQRLAGLRVPINRRRRGSVPRPHEAFGS